MMDNDFIDRKKLVEKFERFLSAPRMGCVADYAEGLMDGARCCLEMLECAPSVGIITHGNFPPKCGANIR